MNIVCLISLTNMELSFLSAALLIFLSLFWFRFRNRNKSKSVFPVRSPPGTTGWPILGENIDFLSQGRKGTPEKFVQDRMKKYSPKAFTTSLIGQTVAILCGPEGNKFIFSNEGNILLSWWPKSVEKIFSIPSGASFPEELNQARESTRAFFNPETLNWCTQDMDTLTKRHLKEDWDDKREVISCPLIKKYAFMFACQLFLAIEDPDHVAKLYKPFNIIKAGIISPHINFPGTPFNRGIKAKNVVVSELVTIIKQKKIELSKKKSVSSQAKDILSYMLMTNDEENSKHSMNEENIAVKLISLFVAHDSLSVIIAFTMMYLAELPKVYNEVLREHRDIVKLKAPGEVLNLGDLQKMSYTWNVVNEVLRFAPTLQGTFAEALVDTSFAGFSIPKGSKVHWNAFTTHKDPKYFPEPEKFDPSRYEGNGPAPYTFVPFGGGPRICPGMAYARCAVLVFLHNLVIRYSWEKVIPDEKIIYDVVPKPANGLPIRLQRHDVHV